MVYMYIYLYILNPKTVTQEEWLHHTKLSFLMETQVVIGTFKRIVLTQPKYYCCIAPAHKHWLHAS